MHSRVLVPLDGSITSPAALTVGRQLAEKWDAELQVLALVEKGQASSGIETLTKRLLDRIDLKPKLEVRRIAYSAAEDIAGEFDLVPDTFVVLSSWARGRSAGVVPNLAEDVFRLVRQPMLLVGPKVEARSDWPDGPLHISIDGSGFSETIAKSAVLFAKSLQIDVRFVTVFDPEDAPGGPDISLETNAIARLADQAQAVLGREANYDVLHSPQPNREIPSYAKRYGAAAIAMATHMRSGVSRLAHGSVTMDVVGQAHCPILVDRPSVGEF